MNVVSLEELERAERWGPPQQEAPPRPPAPIYWHGDAAAESGSYLVKGLLPADGIALLAGQSGAGKTFLAIDLAGSLALAEPFFGRKIRAPAGTLFCAAEAVGTIGERIEAMRKGRDIKKDRLPIAWREVSGLSEPGAMEALINEAIGIGAAMHERHAVPLSLIVVDTLAAAFGFEDENSSAEATRAMQALAQLSARTGALTVAVAHYGKSSETGVRGSSAFTASADVILAALVDRDGEGKVLSRQLALTKSRRTETGWCCPFELHPVDMGKDEDDEVIWSCFVHAVTDEARLAPSPKKSRLPPTGIAYRDALRIALGDHGKQIYPFGLEGSLTLTVDREKVRDEFYRCWPADGTPEQIANTRRQNFNRGEKAALAARIIHVMEIEGVQMVWQLP